MDYSQIFLFILPSLAFAMWCQFRVTDLEKENACLEDQKRELKETISVYEWREAERAKRKEDNLL